MAVTRPGAGAATQRPVAPAPSKIAAAKAQVAQPVGGPGQATGVISLNPDTYSTGGGLLDDADVQITAAQFLMWDYQGTQAKEVPALGVTFRKLDEVAETDESFDHDQYYSAGDAQFFAPSADGSGLVPVGDKTSLNNNCNAATFLLHLVHVGVPKTLLETGYIGSIVGMQLHVNRVKQQERKGLDGSTGKEILVATKLLALPNEAGGGGAAPKPKGPSKIAKPSAARPNGAAPATAPLIQTTAATASPSDSPGSALDDQITEVLQSILAEGPLPRKMVGPKIFSAFKEQKDIQGAAMKRATSEEYLTTAAGGEAFDYDGAMLSLPQ